MKLSRVFIFSALICLLSFLCLSPSPAQERDTGHTGRYEEGPSEPKVMTPQEFLDKETAPSRPKPTGPEPTVQVAPPAPRPKPAPQVAQPWYPYVGGRFWSSRGHEVWISQNDRNFTIADGYQILATGVIFGSVSSPTIKLRCFVANQVYDATGIVMNGIVTEIRWSTGVVDTRMDGWGPPPGPMPGYFW